MKTMKLNFTVPEDIAQSLRARIGKRKRSAFVAAAVLEKLKELEREQLAEMLREGYRARRGEDAGIGEEWEAPTIEKWR